MGRYSPSLCMDYHNSINHSRNPHNLLMELWLKTPCGGPQTHVGNAPRASHTRLAVGGCGFLGPQLVKIDVPLKHYDDNSVNFLSNLILMIHTFAQ